MRNIRPTTPAPEPAPEESDYTKGFLDALELFERQLGLQLGSRDSMSESEIRQLVADTRRKSNGDHEFM